MNLNLNIKANSIAYLKAQLKSVIETIENDVLMEHYAEKYGKYWVDGFRDSHNSIEYTIDLDDYLEAK